METNEECDEPDSGARAGSDQKPKVASHTPWPSQPTCRERSSVWRPGQPGAKQDERSTLLSRTQRLRLTAAHEDCRDDLDLVGLSLSVQISRLQGPAAAEEKSRLIKVRDNCRHLSQQISQLLSELEENRGFHFMQQEDDMEEQGTHGRANEETTELEEEQKEILKEKMQELQEMDKTVAELWHQLDELSENINNKRKSLALARKDRRETKELQRDELELLRKQLKETRAQEEALNYQKNLYREAQQRQEQWEQDANQLLQDKEREFNNVGCRKTLNFDKLSELSRAIMEMQQVVIEDREEEEMLQQLEELGRIAVKVQAWWRGCMVRRGLGKYGKKEEPKKGKKKKQGKK